MKSLVTVVIALETFMLLLGGNTHFVAWNLTITLPVEALCISAGIYMHTFLHRSPHHISSSHSIPDEQTGSIPKPAGKRKWKEAQVQDCSGTNDEYKLLEGNHSIFSSLLPHWGQRFALHHLVKVKQSHGLCTSTTDIHHTTSYAHFQQAVTASLHICIQLNPEWERCGKAHTHDSSSPYLTSTGILLLLWKLSNEIICLLQRSSLDQTRSTEYANSAVIYLKVTEDLQRRTLPVYHQCFVNVHENY